MLPFDDHHFPPKEVLQHLIYDVAVNIRPLMTHKRLHKLRYSMVYVMMMMAKKKRTGTIPTRLCNDKEDARSNYPILSPQKPFVHLENISFDDLSKDTRHLIAGVYTDISFSLSLSGAGSPVIRLQPPPFPLPRKKHQPG